MQEISRIGLISLKKTFNTQHHRILLPGTLIFAGLLFVALGIYQGEVGIVLRKAIHICLECIGIG
ncbi:MAG: CD1871A family CXXC motif-containing protein [Anaerovoracaceae bacterium]